MTPETWVVVGAGAAGSAFARRASRNPSRQIIVLEAGEVPLPGHLPHPDTLDATSLRAALPGHPRNAVHRVSLRPNTPYDIVRGTGLGGSTAINGTYCVRPPESDLLRWADEVDSSTWSPANWQRVYSELETDLDFPDAVGHGSAGPLRVGRESATSFDRGILQTFSHRGMRTVVDVATSEAPLAGMLPKNSVEGRRLDAGFTFLKDPIGTGAVEVRGHTEVVSIVIDDGRAVGVEVVGHDGQLEVIPADRVVLAAGALMSATLLMRSGIGPRAVLAEAEIEALVDSPVIGARFCDHPSVRVQWWPTEKYREDSAGWPPFATVASWRVGERGDSVVEVLPIAKPLPELLGQESDSASQPISWLVSLLTPRSRGRITLRAGTGPAEPVVDCHYLDNPQDSEALRQGVNLVHEVLADPELATWVDRAPGPVTNGQWEGFLSERLGTSYHTTSTVPAGKPGVGAVDGEGRVYGVEGLVVVDVSILPDGPTRGPAYTAMALGWMLGGRAEGAREDGFPTH